MQMKSTADFEPRHALFFVVMEGSCAICWIVPKPRVSGTEKADRSPEPCNIMRDIPLVRELRQLLKVQLFGFLVLHPHRLDAIEAL